jgi:hypothetical protein
MEDLRTRAFRFYLQHALACALAVDSVVHQRKQYLGNATINASALWVQYCRNAQSTCGVFGLAALDRVESMVLYSLRCDCSFEKDDRCKNEDLALKFEKSATCYSKALMRQLSGDLFNAARWAYAGTLYDQVDATKLDDLEDLYLPDPDELREWTTRAVGYGLPTMDNNGTQHHAKIQDLRAEIAQKYQARIAHSTVIAALFAHSKAWADDYIDATSAHESSTDGAKYLIQALKYTQNTLECDKPGEEELQTLWKLCARYARTAAAEVGNDDSDYYTWARAGNGLAHLAERIAPAVRMLTSMSPSTSGLDLTKMKSWLSDIFKLIDESPLVRDPTSDGAQDFASELCDNEEGNFASTLIVDEIGDFTFTLQGEASGWEQERITIQRCLAAADKVNVDQSPAHPHIKQCWLSAAEQMSLAIVAITEPQYKIYHLRSALQEKLALGPLAAAASYFNTANLAVSEQARDLWQEAAQLLLNSTLPMIQYYLQQESVESLTGYEVTCKNSTAVPLKRARRLAEAAACAEQVDVDLTCTETVRELRKVAVQIRLALLQWDAPH